jgi:hypothetical protein
MNLLIDFINKEETKSYTTRPDKIYYNFGLTGVLDQYVTELQKRKETTISLITLFGRWIIIFQGGDINIDDSVMHIIDFRIDLKTEYRAGFFSQDIIDAFTDIQTSYSKVFSEDSDFVKCTYAEPYEKDLKPNLFLCEDNEMVFQKAETLGILSTVENLSNDDEVKVLIAEEKVTVENNNVVNLYAIINFGGSNFGYLKIYDLHNNLERLDDFQTSIEQTGVKFDRSFILKYFTKEVLN